MDNNQAAVTRLDRAGNQNFIPASVRVLSPQPQLKALIHIKMSDGFKRNQKWYSHIYVHYMEWKMRKQ